MIFTTAVKSDLAQCLKLARIKELQLTQGGYLDGKILTQFLKNDLFIVAKTEGKVIGFILGEPMAVSKGVMIWFFTISRNHRGQGIGSGLLAEFEKRCKRMRRQWVILYAPQANKNTVRFYKKNAYSIGNKLVECIKSID